MRILTLVYEEMSVVYDPGFLRILSISIQEMSVIYDTVSVIYDPGLVPRRVIFSPLETSPTNPESITGVKTIT